MQYDQLLRRAWTITWRHKVLWVFGIALAVFSGGTPSMPQYSWRTVDLQQLQALVPRLDRGDVPLRWLRWVQAAWPSVMAVAAAVTAVAVVLWLVGLVVRYTSVGALASMVDDVEAQRGTTFASGLNRGWRRFPRLLAIELLLGLASFAAGLATILILGAIAALLAIPGIAMATAGEQTRVIGIICLVAAAAFFVCLLVIACLALAVVLAIVSAWATRACVIGMQGTFQSIRTGIDLLRRQAVASLSTWLVMALVRLGLSLIAVPVVLIGLSLSGGLGVALWQASHRVPAVAVYGLVALLAMGVVGALFGGVYVTFSSAYWTLAYRNMGPIAEKA